MRPGSAYPAPPTTDHFAARPLRAAPAFAAGRHSWLPPPVQVPARFANHPQVALYLAPGARCKVIFMTLPSNHAGMEHGHHAAGPGTGKEPVFRIDVDPAAARFKH